MTINEATRMLVRIKDQINFEWVNSQGKMDALNMAIETLERKRGEWVYKDMKGQFCSVCDKQSVWKFDFCPNCGADMRERREDAT